MMCGLFKQPKFQPSPPLETPQSDAVRRAGELEALQRQRQAGITRNTVTTPLGLPADASAQMGVSA